MAVRTFAVIEDRRPCRVKVTEFGVGSSCIEEDDDEHQNRDDDTVLTEISQFVRAACIKIADDRDDPDNHQDVNRHINTGEHESFQPWFFASFRHCSLLLLK